MTQTRYNVCEVTTGLRVGTLPLTDLNAGVMLPTPGQFSATLNMPRWGSAGPERFRDLQNLTEPYKYSIVVDQGGAPRGEWIITKRSEAKNGTAYALTGFEFSHMLSRSPMTTSDSDSWNADQFLIARAMVRKALTRQAGNVSIRTDDDQLSGKVRNLRYPAGDATSILQRLNEMADNAGGFDWWFEPIWTSSGGKAYIERRLRLAYPRAGRDQPIRLHRPSPGKPGGNILNFGLDEDGERLASFAIAYGAGEGPTKVIGSKSNLDLIYRGWPAMYRTRAHSSVKTQSIIDGRATSLLALAQSAEVPPQITIQLGNPNLGDFQLGDRLWVQIDPCPTRPDGWLRQVRVLGWTIPPPGPGPKTSTLTVTSMTDVPGDDL